VNLSSLNPQQRLAVETLRGPVLILAGAGTGKTRVITHRIAHLIHRGVPAANILAVTFTNKAAREMKERVASLLPRRARGEDGRKPAGPTVCTFHSLGARVLRRHIDRLGYKSNFVIYDESEQLGAVKKLLSHVSSKGTKADPAQVLNLISRHKNAAGKSEIGNPKSAIADPDTLALADAVLDRYQSALRACNAIDFDDLLLLTLRLLREHPDVLAACRAQYHYVMVDEYQDTNAAQFEIVRALTNESRNLCVVGDDDQSIYGWRGAEIANLLDLEKHFPEVKVIKLEQNYRSTNTILAAANALITRNTRRRPKKLWSDQGAGDKIALHEFEDDAAEAQGIVDEIEFLRHARRVSWRDQAILFRTNQQSRPFELALRQSGVRYHLIGGQSYFDRREIRDFLAYLKVFLNPHDDVSLLRIANVPARGLSDATMEKLLGASQERHCSVYAAMRHTDVQDGLPARTRESLRAFLEFLDHTRAPLETDSHLRLATWAEKFLADIKYPEELRRSEKKAEDAENRLRNVRDLIADLDGAGDGAPTSSLSPTGGEGRGENSSEHARMERPNRVAPPLPSLSPAPSGGEGGRRPGEGAFDEEGAHHSQPPRGPSPALRRLEQFLEDISLDSDREDEDETRGDAVTLITMHSAKGLEFPSVYVVGIEDGILPHSRSKVEGTLDEERRLFYVAMTRAMRRLSLSYCLGRKRYGQMLPCHPSPFLKELPEELIEDAAEKGKQPVAADSGKNLFDAMRLALE
jgi:superfamily I DNA/RNA helicase